MWFYLFSSEQYLTLRSPKAQELTQSVKKAFCIFFSKISFTRGSRKNDRCVNYGAPDSWVLRTKFIETIASDIMLSNKFTTKANRISVDQAIGYQASIPAMVFFWFGFCWRRSFDFSRRISFSNSWILDALLFSWRLESSRHFMITVSISIRVSLLG